jgi:CheY-like chemotaxis protein
MRTLVIDDEPAVATMLARVLREQGHVVAVAHDAVDGLTRIAARVPDVVFLDLVMPGPLDGLDVLRQIRRDHPDLPVIVLTGRADPDQIAEARRIGVTDVVEKPWGLNMLTEALNALPRPAG